MVVVDSTMCSPAPASGPRRDVFFIIRGLQHLTKTLRNDIIEGNFYGATLAGLHLFDVVDLHYHFRFDLGNRVKDGVHWNNVVHRRITNLLLSHVANAWGVFILEKRLWEGQSQILQNMLTFHSIEVRQLLHNKFVVILGDSRLGIGIKGRKLPCVGLEQSFIFCLLPLAVQRSVYKDLVQLLQTDSLLTSSQMKAKGELRFENDHLIEGGVLEGLHNGTNYREVRQYRSRHHLIRFYFLTRVYSAYLESILDDFQAGLQPDVVILNSCVWDVSRYGPFSMKEYRANLEMAFNRLDAVLPSSCLVIWNMTMPLGPKVRGGFLIPEKEEESMKEKERKIEWKEGRKEKGSEDIRRGKYERKKGKYRGRKEERKEGRKEKRGVKILEEETLLKTKKEKSPSSRPPLEIYTSSGVLLASIPEVLQNRVLEAKVFHTEYGTGVAILTGAHRFTMTTNIADLKLRRLPEVP
ncbi:hypothetical protein JD844_026075, partial [Phrynosoma platyrhinos]